MMGSPAMRTDNPCACCGWEEQTGSGALPHIGIERGGVCRFGIKMCNRLLQPRSDFGGGPDSFLCGKAGHLVAQPDLDAAIPKPADPDVDLAVVDFLESAVRSTKPYEHIRCLAHLDALAICFPPAILPDIAAPIPHSFFILVATSRSQPSRLVVCWSLARARNAN
jgi:hypothetical protein